MKQYLQSYHAFLPGRYVRWIIYLVYPAAMLLLLFVGGIFVERSILMVILPFLMVSVECIIDMFVFGGFGARDIAREMEYVKGSVKGRGMVNRALIFDWVRRFLYELALLGIFYVTFYVEQGYRPASALVWGMLCLMAMAGLFNSIALWLIRFIDSRPAQAATLYMAMFLPALIMLFLGEQKIDIKEFFAFCMVGYILSVVGQIALLMKKVKEGYYDR